MAMVTENILTRPLYIRQMHFCLGPSSRKWEEREIWEAQRGDITTPVWPGCRIIWMGMSLLLSLRQKNMRKQSLAELICPSLLYIAMFLWWILWEWPLCHTASLLAASLPHKDSHSCHLCPVQLFPKTSWDQLPSSSLNGNSVAPLPRTQLFLSLLISELWKQIWILVERKWMCKTDKSLDSFTWVSLPHPSLPAGHLHPWWMFCCCWLLSSSLSCCLILLSFLLYLRVPDSFTKVFTEKDHHDFKKETDSKSFLKIYTYIYMYMYKSIHTYICIYISSA